MERTFFTASKTQNNETYQSDDEKRGQIENVETFKEPRKAL